jgi:hypothetical protein
MSFTYTYAFVNFSVGPCKLTWILALGSRGSRRGCSGAEEEDSDDDDNDGTRRGGVGDRISHPGVQDEGFQAGVDDEISDGSGMGVVPPAAISGALEGVCGYELWAVTCRARG